MTPPGRCGTAVLGLGIGAPGPLDPRSGRICFAPNLHWRDFNLRDTLHDRLGIPVFLENDANLAALGEHLYGAGQGNDDMVFITVSTGIGGGLILRGEIYDGAFGGAGEIGTPPSVRWPGMGTCSSRKRLPGGPDLRMGHQTPGPGTDRGRRWRPHPGSGWRR